MDRTPPGSPYGPNTAAVRRFLQRFAALDTAQWTAIADAFAEIERTPRFAAADRALADTIAHADLGAARDAVVGPIVQMTGRAPAGAAEDARPELHPVAAAALAAALALVVRGVADARTFDTLYEPFAAVVPLDVVLPRA